MRCSFSNLPLNKRRANHPRRRRHAAPTPASKSPNKISGKNNFIQPLAVDEKNGLFKPQLVSSYLTRHKSNHIQNKMHNYASQGPGFQANLKDMLKAPKSKSPNKISSRTRPKVKGRKRKPSFTGKAVPRSNIDIYKTEKKFRKSAQFGKLRVRTEPKNPTTGLRGKSKEAIRSERIEKELFEYNPSQKENFDPRLNHGFGGDSHPILGHKISFGRSFGVISEAENESEPENSGNLLSPKMKKYLMQRRKSQESRLLASPSDKYSDLEIYRDENDMNLANYDDSRLALSDKDLGWRKNSIGGEY